MPMSGGLKPTKATVLWVSEPQGMVANVMATASRQLNLECGVGIGVYRSK